MIRRFAPSAPVTAPPGNADDLTALARRVERLTPSHRDPESYFIERSEIAYALRRIATTTSCAGAKRDRDIEGSPRMTGYGGWKTQ